MDTPDFATTVALTNVVGTSAVGTLGVAETSDLLAPRRITEFFSVDSPDDDFSLIVGCDNHLVAVGDPQGLLNLLVEVETEAPSISREAEREFSHLPFWGGRECAIGSIH